MSGQPDDPSRAQASSELAARLAPKLDEIDAQLSTQRFLLEQVYARAFLRDPSGFDAFINEALAALQARPRMPGPKAMSAEQIVEAQSQIGAQLERFRFAVARCISSLHR
jgi:tRNA nucleotidyltransferase (CCA-adding enzyme)